MAVTLEMGRAAAAAAMTGQVEVLRGDSGGDIQSKHAKSGDWSGCASVAVAVAPAPSDAALLLAAAEASVEADASQPASTSTSMRQAAGRGGETAHAGPGGETANGPSGGAGGVAGPGLARSVTDPGSHRVGSASALSSQRSHSRMTSSSARYLHSSVTDSGPDVDSAAAAELRRRIPPPAAAPALRAAAAEGVAGAIAEASRRHGCRLPNCGKNTGRAAYCFSNVQRSFFPPQYRCPPGTGGGGMS